MSKVICDVCGTTYPETANQCPICGSAKNSAGQTTVGAGETEAASSGYTYVKGGRFSKKNVRKRNKKGTTAMRRSAPRQSKQASEPNNTGLVIVVILLLIAIAAVLIHIGVKFFQGQDNPDPSGNTGDTQNTAPSQDGTEEQPVEVPCIGVSTLTVIELSQVGESWKLEVELTPLDTTDTLRFETSDPNVVKVTEDGIVTAVGEGSADITVICGNAIATCVVHCNIEAPTEPPVIEPFVMEFNTIYTDSTTGLREVSLNKKGETWRAYKSGMSADPAEVTWITDDPNVCTVENGVVTAVGRGLTKIHAQYNGTTYSCIVRCNVPAEEEETEPVGSCKISHTDVTIAVGESFYLTLKDADGNKLEVVWEPNDVNVTIDGNKITGASSGRVIVSTTYEDVTYSCVIHVK